jgi:hypothetical protein
MKKSNKVLFSVALSCALTLSLYSNKSYAANVKNSTAPEQGVNEVSQGDIVINNSINNGLSSVTIHWSIQADNVNKTVIDSFEIEKIEGTMPIELQVSQFLQDANDDQTGRNDVPGLNRYHNNMADNLSASWNSADIYVGNTKTEVVPAQTKFWSVSGQASAFYIGKEIPVEVDKQWQAPYTAINANGDIFPDYTDSWSGKKASAGLRTDWTKTANPVAWSSSARNTAISQYINLYGDTKWDWSNYQIYHVQPIAYGGTNDISNLIAIPYQQYSAITAWFNKY